MKPCNHILSYISVLDILLRNMYLYIKGNSLKFSVLNITQRFVRAKPGEVGYSDQKKVRYCGLVTETAQKQVKEG